MHSTFWLQKPCALFENLEILPCGDMSKEEKLNALTRLIILISLVLFVSEVKWWLQFLVLGIVFVIILSSSLCPTKKEGFTINPTYAEGSIPTTTVPPLFAEEWQIPSPSYDIYEWSGAQTPSQEAVCEQQKNVLTQRSYPIMNQYITDTSVIPFEEEELKNRPTKDVKMFMSDSFTRDQMDFRNDMTRIYTNKLNREFNHGCNQNITPYSSW